MINGLSPIEATIIKMKHSESSSAPATFDRLAEKLNMNPNTIKSIYYRACEKLKEGRKAYE